MMSIKEQIKKNASFIILRLSSQASKLLVGIVIIVFLAQQHRAHKQVKKAKKKKRRLRRKQLRTSEMKKEFTF